VFWAFVLYITNDLEKIDAWVGKRIRKREQSESEEYKGEGASEEGELAPSPADAGRSVQ
jgi:hypothetical protein